MRGCPPPSPEEDAAIDSGSATLREKKVSDLHNRVALVNELPGAVLLSIHQNSLPSSPSTRGAQVFWNRQEGAEELASSIQEALNGAVNAGHEKKAAQVPSSVLPDEEDHRPGRAGGVRISLQRRRRRNS
ncbi:MAG: N-acetylmuramoyl-L-alanine amidase [Dysosmobacter sp.]